MNGGVLWAPLHFGVTWCYLGTTWVSFGFHLGVTWCHLVIIWVSLGVIWLSCGCHLAVPWLSPWCHLVVTWVSLRCNFDVTGCHFKWHLIGDYSVTVGRMYLCPVGTGQHIFKNSVNISLFIPQALVDICLEVMENWEILFQLPISSLSVIFRVTRADQKLTIVWVSNAD